MDIDKAQAAEVPNTVVQAIDRPSGETGIISRKQEKLQETAGRSALTETVGVEPQELLADIMNMVTYYCAKGFDSFDETLLTSMVLSKEQAHAALKGSIQVYGTVLGQMQQHMSEFQRSSLSGALRIPPAIQFPQASNLGETVDAEDEEKLDEQLKEAKANIEMACANELKYQIESKSLKRELDLAGDTASLDSFTASVSANKANLIDDTHALVENAQKLLPLLKGAQMALASHHQHKADMDVANGVAEKEVLARKTAARGILTEDLRQIRNSILATH